MSTSGGQKASVIQEYHIHRNNYSHWNLATFASTLDVTFEVLEKSDGSHAKEIIKDKIRQPFFTTKPAGSGTGVGLSLSYDIVKAHGGELTVQTKEGEGSAFVIILPVV